MFNIFVYECDDDIERNIEQRMTPQNIWKGPNIITINFSCANTIYKNNTPQKTCFIGFVLPAAQLLVALIFLHRIIVLKHTLESSHESGW